MTIDAHVHVWDLGVRPQPWTAEFPLLQRSFALDDLTEDRTAAAIDAVVLVQADACFDETLDLLEQAEAHTEVAGVVGWFDLTADVPAQIARARSHAGGRFLVGARHQLQLEPDPRWLARDGVRCGLEALAEVDLSYDVVVSPEQLPMVLDVATALPQLRFVLDHGGKPPIASGDLRAWRSDIERLSARPNVAVKASGLVTEADWEHWSPSQLRPVIDHLLARFGPSRVMFGSDWPVCRLASSYAEVVATFQASIDALDDDDMDDDGNNNNAREAVWGGTARAWYRIVSR